MNNLDDYELVPVWNVVSMVESYDGGYRDSEVLTAKPKYIFHNYGDYEEKQPDAYILKKKNIEELSE